MPGIHHALIIGVPIERVYSAITRQEELSQWWTPGTRAIAAINTIAQFPFGADYSKEMNITELRPSWLVKWTCVKGTKEWLGTNISFSLLDGNKESLMHLHPEMKGQIDQLTNDKATLVIFNHDNWKNYTLRFAECSYTWALFLRSLKLFCETGRGTPWPDHHLAPGNSNQYDTVTPDEEVFK